MVTQAGLWIAAGSALLVAAIATFAEWRRSRRRHLDRVGWMPWAFIQIIAFIGALAAAALALKV